MYVLGFSDSHDAAVCLLHDGRIASALAVERLSRVKRAALPIGASPLQVRSQWAERQRTLQYCCEAAGITPAQVDHLCVASPDSRSDLEVAFNGYQVAGAFACDRLISMPHPEHHLAHAYSAFFTSGFEDAAALVVDSYANPTDKGRISHSAYLFGDTAELPGVVFQHFKGNRVQGMGGALNGWQLDSRELDGIGEIYRIITLILGFYQQSTIYDDAGKTMGLAPYGSRLSRHPVLMRPIGGGRIDFSNAYPYLEGLGLIDEERRLATRPAGTELTDLHRNLAAQVQWEFEEAVVHLARHVQRETTARRLVLAGGSFLNVSANRRILQEGGFDEVFPFAAATDDGTAVGAAYYGHQQALRARGQHPVPRRIRSMGLGRAYSADEIAAELARWPLPHQVLESPLAAGERAGELLAAGHIIGWFQGGSEFGPRALGQRSILADPRLPDIKDTLNSRVKFREAFRPFAPAACAELAPTYFEMPVGFESPFMLQAFPVRTAYRDRLPGITHVDGSARVQTVRAEDDPPFHALISSFGARTGLSVVLNTSFNLRGMPIVESPFHALCCLVMTEMDDLVIGNVVVPVPDRMDWVPCFRPRTGGRPQAGEPGKLKVSSPQEGDAVNRLLARIDGRSTLRAISAHVGLEEPRLLRLFLDLVRRGVASWVGVPVEVV